MKISHLFALKLLLTASIACYADAPIPAQQSPSLPQPTVYVAKDYSRLVGMTGFSDQALSIHFKLYQGYVSNVNAMLDKFAKSPQMMGTIEWADLRRRFGWEFDGMRLHEMYFDNLGGDGSGIDDSSPLYKAIVTYYGTYDAWEKDFRATGAMRGIGWAVLYQDPKTGMITNCWIDEHDLGHLAGGTPLLVMDVFEHAYLLDYGLNRGDYINAFFSNVNWKEVAKRYVAPVAAK